MGELQETAQTLITEACEHPPGRMPHPKAVPLPLPEQARTIAQQFADAQMSVADRQPQVVTVQLGQWFNQTFAAEWCAVDSLLSFEQSNLAFSFRSVDESDADASFVDEAVDASAGRFEVNRAKLIDVGLPLGDVQVVLLMEIQIESPDKTNIGLQVHPAGGKPYLPPGLELTVLEAALPEATDTVFMEARARQADNYIQLQFSGQPGERFRVRLRLEGVRYLEEFVM